MNGSITSIKRKDTWFSHPIITIKRTIIVRQDNNKQIKILSRQLVLGIIIPSFQNLLNLVRTSTNWGNYWIQIECLIIFNKRITYGKKTTNKIIFSEGFTKGIYTMPDT